ncbi:hypothetical protein MATL_G00210870 [Megalops atlanticus]|uniref:SMP-LTD domain-containing protein n=1 Tax=Megalops atlanticus TaxID=7932 RepID=A0A9D3SXG3_MEGAT|nr:hypothetical protein MATL_G00210870 [Megalops atlanticus]
MAEAVDESDSGPHRSSQSRPLPASPPELRSADRQAIVIETWDSTDDSGLAVSLDRNEEGPPVSSSEESCSGAGRPAEGRGARSPPSRAPVSPSSPGVLGDRSASAPAFLLPTSSTPAAQPLVNLVKSLSTEIESKDGSSPSSLRPKPLLSLVKSLSTEISRREPEVAQSKSDSKLNLHLWKQLTQPKGQEEEPGAAPPSPTCPSPTEPKGRFFKAELEDTRRKFSEAMQEPLSMLSKIIGEDSPKQQRVAGATDSPGGGGEGRGGAQGVVDGEGVELEGERVQRAGGGPPPAYAMPTRKPRRKLDLSPALSRDNRYEICTYGDVIQVVEIAGPGARDGVVARQGQEGQGPRGLPCSVPGTWLFCVSVLAYSFFVLPLPSYLAGLALGLAGGFMLGLLVVLLLAPRRSSTLPHRNTPSQQDTQRSQTPGGEHKHPKVLEGWMNEMHAYDPEAYHPSLTHPVHATLEGCRLQLAYPRGTIPRRATFHDPPHEAVFVRSRRFQLAGSKVFLLPAVLARKRVWNKKYPICVVLAEGEEGGEEEGLGETHEEEKAGAGTGLPPLAQPGIPTTLYLFGRTGREKEEWFQHLLAASKVGDQDGDQDSGSKSDVSAQQGSSPTDQAQWDGGSSRGSSEDIPSLLRLKDLAGSVREKILLDYSSYMARFVSPPPSPSHVTGDSSSDSTKPCDPASSNGEAQTTWINALIGRIFWDFLREKYWANQVAHKIQKKLTKIRLPYFMNELTLSELDMGTCMPQVVSTSKPSVDNRGLWLELEVAYTGSFQMTLETKMNLCKLGKEGGAEADSVPESGSVSSRPRLCVLADSDEESSSAGSSDEEEVPPSEPQGTQGDKGTPAGADIHGGCSTSRKILRFVDKIAKSKYFQKATENEYIKKKIEEVSNTPLHLTVEVQELSGTLAVNIPPPPTDRIWYSFRVPPRLDLRVRPMLGEREVTFTHVTEWIERKLQREFEKVLVMPNMDDLYLPLMHSGLDSPPTSHHSPVPHSHQSSEDMVQGEDSVFE